MQLLKKLVKKYNSVSLILRILVGLMIGTGLGLFVPQATGLVVLGNLFVGALKAIAPVVVFVLVVSALAQKSSKMDQRFGLVIGLYLLTTLLASVWAVVASFLFPQKIILADAAATEGSVAPTGLAEVMSNLLNNLVTNPISAIMDANYIGILFWAILVGLAFKKVGKHETVNFLTDVSEAVSQCVRWIINLAPFGICGLVFNTVSTNGVLIFVNYGSLILLLVGSMLFVALVINPIVVFAILRKNPYPLIFRCLRESGLTAFFTRSSAANIPVNMSTCEKLGLDKDMYSVSIPLGATINMDGAAITIAIMTLATANTMGISVSFPTALVLSLLATLSACGASGVAGGSLLLIPMACSLFGIGNDVAMQTVAVGFIIGVIQDSVETALNSAGDVCFAATAEYYEWKKKGKELPYFLGGNMELDI